MLYKPKHSSPLISRLDFRERIKAFAITAFAVFALSCLVWPISVSGFRSVAGINLDSTSYSKQQLERLLVDAVQREATSDRLDSLISEMEANGKLQNGTIEKRDFEAIRKSIQIGVTELDGRYRLQVVYDGTGQSEERNLVDLLTNRVAVRLNTPLTDGAENSGLAVSTGTEQQSALFQETQLSNYRQASSIINQIETELGQLKQFVRQLPSDGATLPQYEAKQQKSRFQLASDSRRQPSNVDRLTESIDSIDVDSLKQLLSQMKSRLAKQAGSPLDSQQADQLEIESLNRTKTIPIGGVPGITALWILASLSGLAGSIVAWNYNPFDSRGFTNTSELEKRLKIPVLATLRDSRGAHVSAGSPTTPHVKYWANRVVATAGLFLFGMFVVIVGFLLSNAEIRQSFFENPFFGAAKIIWLFAGY